MQMRQLDHKHLDEFVQEFLFFLEKRSEGNVYKKGSIYNADSGYIELADGSLVSTDQEAPFVLDKEFDRFIIETANKMFKEMYANLDTKLFAFAERTLYELITTWVFITAYSTIPAEVKNRLKVMLLAGQYKFFPESGIDDKGYNLYLSKQSHFLRQNDIEALTHTDNHTEYFDRLHDVIIGILNNNEHKEHSLSFLRNNPKFHILIGHQHMRIHANPMALNEAFGEIDRNVRHKLLLAMYARQVIDYIQVADPDNYKKLKYRYDKFENNSKFKIN